MFRYKSALSAATELVSTVNVRSLNNVCKAVLYKGQCAPLRSCSRACGKIFPIEVNALWVRRHY